MTTPAVSTRSTVVTVDPRTDSGWAELVTSRTSDVFHSPEWARVLADTYGFEPKAKLLLDEEGKPRAGLAYVDVDDARGRRLVSMPFSDFCDPLVDDSSDWDTLTADLPLDSVPATIRCLRHPMVDGRWVETASFAWHRVDSSRPEADAWAAIDSGARRAIRKAAARGVEVSPATGEAELRAFFELHLRVRKHKYGLLAQPWRFFEAIWEHFLADGNGTLLLARVDGQLLGAVLYLKWRDTLYYKFNASDPSGLEVRPNDLLMWSGVDAARERGLAWVDLGVSDWEQEGLVRYKRKYATEEGVVRKFSAGPPLHDRLGPILGALTRLLVGPDVPDLTTEKGGDTLYGLFC